MKYLRRIIIILFVTSSVLYLLVSILERIKADIILPVIRSQEESLVISVKDNQDDLLQGLIAYDEMDGDLTSEIIVREHTEFSEKGKCEVTYVVFDKSNNVAQYTRQVLYEDYQSPKFSLIESTVYTIGSDVSIVDRLEAYDDLDGNITQKIRFTAGNVDANIAGEYFVKAEVRNEYGDIAEIEIPVLLIDKGAHLEIKLTDLVVYIQKGTVFRPEEYIVEVSNIDGSLISKENVSIVSSVEENVVGCYRVIYSCTEDNITGYNCMVVIVTN